jgi:hypothetical protein
VGRVQALWPWVRRAELFSPTECSELVALADAQDGWREAIVARGAEARVRRGRRRARQLSVAGGRADASLPALFEPWLLRVERLALELDRDHFQLGIRGIHDAQLVEYVRGGFYGWHPDARDHAFRKLTALCYLTDRQSDAVRGGETSFAPPALARLVRRGRRPASWLRWLPTAQTPRRGRVLLFDSTLLHCAHRVSAGRKVSLNVWFA